MSGERLNKGKKGPFLFSELTVRKDTGSFSGKEFGESYRREERSRRVNLNKYVRMGGEKCDPSWQNGIV